MFKFITNVVHNLKLLGGNRFEIRQPPGHPPPARPAAPPAPPPVQSSPAAPPADAAQAVGPVLLSPKALLLIILSESVQSKKLAHAGAIAELGENDAKFFLMTMRFIRKLYDQPLNEKLPADTVLLDEENKSVTLREVIAEASAKAGQNVSG